ncbi:hypothetical protein [Gloeothece verrucosa]|uniref:Uncharacterized protein n=1 Tax=Gloeothece verrucosa (strain PCC 7822) TaxID=497965 RepID=E0UKG7_GLOV7|nr:hypothetical protein [Gloeothece verrucosa]ADN17048.1 hypothetical protein Cyan7822_5165 [Gloeothece verrucosa PCC 7822]
MATLNLDGYLKVSTFPAKLGTDLITSFLDSEGNRWLDLNDVLVLTELHEENALERPETRLGVYQIYPKGTVVVELCAVGDIYEFLRKWTAKNYKHQAVMIALDLINWLDVD